MVILIIRNVIKLYFLCLGFISSYKFILTSLVRKQKKCTGKSSPFQLLKSWVWRWIWEWWWCQELCWICHQPIASSRSWLGQSACGVSGSGTEIYKSLKIFPGADFTNILRTPFLPIFLRQKIKKPNFKYKKSARITFVLKSCS